MKVNSDMELSIYFSTIYICQEKIVKVNVKSVIGAHTSFNIMSR